MDELDEPRSAPRPKPSKIPSWIMLGFFLGALFVWRLPHSSDPPARVPIAAAVKAPAIPSEPDLTEVEAVFAAWSDKYAVWAGNITYVCLFNSGTRTMRDCFEVYRRGDDYFFRSIPRPKNLRPLEGIPSECPMEFFNPVPEVRGLFGVPPPAVEKLPRPN